MVILGDQSGSNGAAIDCRVGVPDEALSSDGLYE
jgi:hypothetical protein